MTRMYIQPSFVDSCSDHGEWSGGNGQYRGDRSVEVVPTYINGRPNVRAFSDEAIAARRAKKSSSIPLADRILPQKRRVDSLTAQMVELEAEYKAGKMSITDYSLYRDIVAAKRDRAIVLLYRAMKVKPKSSETDEDSAQVQAEYTSASGFSPQGDDGYTSEESEEIGVVWIDELSETNSLKSFLKFSCKALRKVLQFSHKVRAYYQTLKEV